MWKRCESGSKRFTVEIDGIRYEGARYSRYRVWCLQQLRDHFEALPAMPRLMQRHC